MIAETTHPDFTMMQGTNPEKPALLAGPRGSKIVRLTAEETERFSVDEEYRFSLKLDVVDLAMELECTIEIFGADGSSGGVTSLWLFDETTALQWKRDRVR